MSPKIAMQRVYAGRAARELDAMERERLGLRRAGGFRWSLVGDEIDWRKEPMELFINRDGIEYVRLALGRFAPSLPEVTVPTSSDTQYVTKDGQAIRETK